MDIKDLRHVQTVAELAESLTKRAEELEKSSRFHSERIKSYIMSLNPEKDRDEMLEAYRLMPDHYDIKRATYKYLAKVIFKDGAE